MLGRAHCKTPLAYSEPRTPFTMTATLKTLRVKDPQQWRAWLTKHHASKSGSLARVLQGPHAGMGSIGLDDTVREALCFGWIDKPGQIVSDDDRYALKITPRRPASKWSDVNRNGGPSSRRQACSRRPASRPAPTSHHLRAAAGGPDPARLYRQSAEERMLGRGRSSGSCRPPSGAISSSGSTSPNVRKPAPGVFANQSACWLPERSLA